MSTLTQGIYLAIILCAVACAKGQRGEQGPAGMNGQSITGPQGVPGEDGTEVTLKQFCPGTTHYPDTFCEVGFCVGSKLYAVYSANDGFESEIVPGTYASHGINCSCQFQVLTGCGISH